MTSSPSLSDMSQGRRFARAEVWIVLALGLGQSAVYAIVALIARLTAGKPLSQQGAALNAAQASREWLDATYQFLGNLFPLAVVALAMYLLWRDGSDPFRRVGLDFRAPRFDVSRMLLLVVCVGIPGIGVYVLGRLLGLTVAVQAAELSQYWWTIPMLLLAAARAALEEEVVLLGFLWIRPRGLGWRPGTLIVLLALLRGSYHLYQGPGPFFANVAMGLIFGWCCARWGRVMPLVLAHFAFDAIQFVGYPLAVDLWPAVFGPPA
ncbi:MAG TPA: CPBP family intramembrane glutamic endopeptidase [Microbacteriaceae bacterium]|nr:CPBP family intramembrane glutamic endopeptidase [Microbacteriaceae bacterium]